MTRDPVELVRMGTELINRRGLRAHAGELIDPEFVRHDLVDLFPESRGPGGAADFRRNDRRSDAGPHLDIADIVGTGDRVAVLLRMIGTHTGEALLGQAASGRRLSANAIFVYRVSDGRLAECWQMIDGLAFHRLAGLIKG